MATIQELLFPFACSIHAKATALKRLELTAAQRARLREAISDDIKKCTNFMTPEVSESALVESRRLMVDLRSSNWHDQPKFDPGRQTFHFEHVVPVSAVREACLQCSSDGDIHAILQTRLRVAWILKKEDGELTRLGFRSARKDPDAAYRKAGIKLVRVG